MFVNKNNIDYQDKNRGPQSIDGVDLLLNEEFCMLQTSKVRFADTQMYTDGDRRHIDIAWTPQISKDVATMVESNMRVLASQQGLGVIDINSNKELLSNISIINIDDYTTMVARNAEVDSVLTRVGQPKHNLGNLIEPIQAVKDLGDDSYDYALELSDDVIKALVNKFPDEDLDVLHSNALLSSCESLIEHHEAVEKADEESQKHEASADSFLDELKAVATVEEVSLSSSDFDDLKESGLQQ